MKFILLCLFIVLLKTGILEAANCTLYDQQCKSGECLRSELFCDGHIDCKDGSDETPDFCIHIKCPSFSFRCAYGACINRDLICNNNRDCIDNSDENSFLCGKVDHFFKNGHCLNHYFQCKSGHCIPVEDVCDGVKDCSDSSDEMVDLCAGIYCPVYAFRCGYGSCISGALKCDGVEDCYDGSDEAAILCGNEFNSTTKSPLEIDVTTPATIFTTIATKPIVTTMKTTATPGTAVKPTTAEKPIRGCVLPNRPDLIVVLDATGETIPMGAYVNNHQSISYTCHPKHLLEGQTTNICLDGQWKTSHPKCTKYCSNKIIQGLTFNANCMYNGVTISCDDYLRPGTIVHISCKVGYRKPNRILQEYLRCDELGEWDYTPFRCEAACGIVETEIQPLISGGKKMNGTHIPWHVPIYSRLSGRYKQICGGTIINAKLVISAAHCFWNDKEERPYSPSYFSVAAGKYFRDYSDQEPLQIQFFNLSEIHIRRSRNYNYMDTSLLYHNDIALLVLDKFIEFKSYVKPICIEWLNPDESMMMSGRIGKVAGWGRIDTNHPSNKEIRMTELETLSNSDCLVKLSARFGSVTVGDKFCVTSMIGDGFCNEDNGGGFVIPKTINGVETYYLWGIIGNGFNNNGKCDPDEITTCTNIQFHSLMIQDYELRFRPK